MLLFWIFDLDGLCFKIYWYSLFNQEKTYNQSVVLVLNFSASVRLNTEQVHSNFFMFFFQNLRNDRKFGYGRY